jgi:hypothetical protein
LHKLYFAQTAFCTGGFLKTPDGTKKALSAGFFEKNPKKHNQLTD